MNTGASPVCYSQLNMDGFDRTGLERSRRAPMVQPEYSKAPLCSGLEWHHEPERRLMKAIPERQYDPQKPTATQGSQHDPQTAR